MATRTGLDVLIQQDFNRLDGKNIAIVCNQASIAADCRHVLEHLLEAGNVKIQCAFGPQHGLWGHTQDNMIEWEGGRDLRFPFPIHSLYGERREPAEKDLKGVELFVVDLPEVGSRYYTFIWTMALCLKACERLGIPVLVLDRPNPIGGAQVEGPVGDKEFASFVGLYPLPVRHGMTMGEIARHLKSRYFPTVQLEIVEMQGWRRDMYFAETGLPWAMPSPNMPTPDTALVYPGGCLLEATNISEGRGTTRPFELFGAPFIDGFCLSKRLNALGLEGVYFRPVQFQPTFHKFAGEICEGAFVHVLDRAKFTPFLTYVAIFQEIVRLYGDSFAWNSPPYEYEYVKLPIDILAGNSWIRKAVETLTPLAELRDRAQNEWVEFQGVRQASSLYPIII